MSARIFIDTGKQAVEQAVAAFSDSHRMVRNPTLEQELSTKMVALLKGMDLSEAQFRHVATVVLNDERRIQSGTATAERRAELAMHAVDDLKGLLGVHSTSRVLTFVHALNAHLRERHPDIHAVLANNEKRGGALGSDPFVVRHLASHYKRHLAAADKASQSAHWPKRKAAEQVSANVPAGGVLSGHIPDASVVARQREITAAAARTPPSFDDAA